MSANKKPKTGIYAILAKLGGKILSLLAKLGKLFKFTKVGLAGLSFAGYAAIYNWKFAILLMVAVGFHESGHVWAMKKKGIKTKGFYFLPFIGGAAIAEENYKTYGDNFYISIMGPAWGAALAYLCAGVYWLTGNQMMAAASGFMCALNLFNLLPITPLDGGQMVRSIAFSINKKTGIYMLVGSFLLSIVVFWYIKSGLFLLITIVGGLELWSEYKKYQKAQARLIYEAIYKNTEFMKFVSAENNKYPDTMTLKQASINGALYVGLIVVLFTLLYSIKHLPGADIAANFLS